MEAIARGRGGGGVDVTGVKMTKLEQIEQIRRRVRDEIKAILGYVPAEYIEVGIRIHEQGPNSLLVREAQYLECPFKSRGGTRWFDVPKEPEEKGIGETTVYLERLTS